MWCALRRHAEYVFDFCWKKISDFLGSRGGMTPFTPVNTAQLYALMPAVTLSSTNSIRSLKYSSTSGSIGSFVVTQEPDGASDGVRFYIQNMHSDRLRTTSRNVVVALRALL